ncbi:MAG: serine hydrolase domain-containing protein [Byssovorax sp.]
MLRLTRRGLVVTALLVSACGEPPPPSAPVAPLPVPAASSVAAPAPAPGAPAKPSPERLSANTPRATGGGATFTAPAGWSITANASLVVLEPPEPDSHFALVDVNAPSADAAVAAAWAAYRPDAKRPLKLASTRPARKGWEERRVYDYETSPNERAVAYAEAFRHGAAWTVLIVEATKPTFERRLAQVLLLQDSLRPKGYEREVFTGKKAHALDASRIKLLGEFIETAQKQLGIPGVAISLVDGGKVVFEGGFGVRELGKPKPIDADTLFLAASNTKGMTTLMLAKLVDEGKLAWDMPVTKVYPDFKLGDAATTSNMQIKHLVCACTGLPRQDLEWLFEYKNATPKTEIDLLGTMAPTTKFGETFQYSNLLASVAGFVGGHVLYPDRELGAAYDEAMRTRVFEPLGMKTTTFDLARAERGNHARPHGEDVDGNPSVARMDLNRSILPLRPAGGVWTSARDLMKYVQLELAAGKLPDGKRYISEENILARRIPQVTIGEDGTYGMGLEVNRTWGVPVVHHGGSLFGYKSDLLFLPEHGIGAVILANSNSGGALLRPFMRRVLEVVFDGRPEAAEDVESRAKERKASIAKDRERLVVPADAAEVARLAPRYTSAALGEIAVKKQGTTTVFDSGEWSSAVASRKNDDGTISFLTIAPAANGFEFVAGERAGKRVLIVRDAQHEYVFTEAR